MSIRLQLLVAFAALAVIGIGLTAAAGVWIVRERTTAYAVQAFGSAREQLAASLRLRYGAFDRLAEQTRQRPELQRIAGLRDRADMGFGGPEDDRARWRELHGFLADADWTWVGASTRGGFAVTDYKARVVYTNTAPGTFGGSLRALAPIAAAYDAASDFRSAGVVRSDDAALVGAGIRPTSAGCVLVLVRGFGPQRDRAGAALVLAIPTDELLEDVRLSDPGTRLALVGADGFCSGSVPDEVRDRGLALADDAAPLELRASGARWLVQRFPLPSLDQRAPIATLIVARDLDVGLALLQQATGSIALAAVVLLGVAAVAAWWLSDRFARPVRELEAAAGRVAEGALDVSVPVRSSDEIGRLAATFNRMTEGLRERDRIRATFKKYVAAEVVDYLLAHPEAQALGGQRCEVSVLFSDLVGFTTLSESMEPEAVVALLNEYFTEVSRRIAARGGTLDKYLGDAVMAFFGAPVPRRDHAAAACLAALDHLAALCVLVPRWQTERGATFSVRIGVNTGDVIVGNIGGENAQDYTVIGDAVNLASRLEGVNKEYGTRILVTEATVSRAAGAVEVREVDLVRVKGKTVAVRIYEVLAAAGELGPERARVREQYALGLAHHRARRFDEACAAFAGALRIDPADGPSATMRARAEAFLREPPPPDWDGVHDLHSK